MTLLTQRQIPKMIFGLRQILMPSHERSLLTVNNGLPGVGDEAIFMAAEKDIEIFMSQRDATRQLVITSRSAINDFSGGSTNQAYQIEIIVSYEYQEI